MASVQVAGAGGWRPKQQHLHQHYYQQQPPPPHPHPYPPPQPQPLEIREVWADNVDREFKLIRAAIEHFPYVSMDTEFPGVIHHPPPTVHHSTLTASQRYALLKSNVDALHLIQVGLSFAASPSSPPALAFQINLREFDPRVHRHAPDSVRLLTNSGVDLAAHRARGVSARAFAALLMSSGLICNPDVAWVTFASAYDFAYLVKVLMGRKLPKAPPCTTSSTWRESPVTPTARSRCSAGSSASLVRSGCAAPPDGDTRPRPTACSRGTRSGRWRGSTSPRKAAWLRAPASSTASSSVPPPATPRPSWLSAARCCDNHVQLFMYSASRTEFEGK